MPVATVIKMRCLLLSLVAVSAYVADLRAQLIIPAFADATIFNNSVVQPQLYNLVLRTACSAIEFEHFESKPFRSIQLGLNMYALPLFTRTIEVYAYEDADGLMTAQDCGRGTYIGTWILPDLNFYEETYFDVTDFVHSAKGTFIGFSLHTEDDGPAVFSSLEA